MQSITLRSGLERKSALSVACAALKLQIRALAFPHLTRGWLNLLNSHGTLRELAQSQPRLIHKIYRPYLSNRLDRGERLAALVAHYRFVLQHGLGAAMLQAARGRLELASFAGKSGEMYYIDLRAIVPLEREGEMVLQLRCGQALVYSVAFSFLTERRQASIGVGCLQGPQCGDGLALAREATRDLHGLRPKQLLLRLVHQLGHAYGCERMLLVGNGNRAVRKQMRKGKVMADYDAFWRELGARPRADGDFELDCLPLQEPDMEQIPSRKRSEARKRHALLSELVDSVIGALRQSPARPALVLAEAPPAQQRDNSSYAAAA
ncbi:MAG: DUF535 family protein [Pseudomonadota bacterium]